MYIGMMNVYLNRYKKEQLKDPSFIRVEKEKMDMGQLKEYYRAYYEELKKYVLDRADKDDEGYIYSAIIPTDGERFKSKRRSDFEIDHIIPISDKGLTIKENLRLISRHENLEKSYKLENKN